MEEFKNFLEFSTIHGLTYISTTRTLVRLFWIVVVILGFSTASLLIYQSFQAWEESPVSTTIETLPISKITFPKVTVCPPKQTYTDLNYDLMMLQNTTLDNDTRNDLTNYAFQLLQDQLHDGVMKRLDLLKDDDRYYNWYHGFTQINIPSAYSDGSHYYAVTTYATYGNISTQYFGDRFNGSKVETSVTLRVAIVPT